MENEILIPVLSELLEESKQVNQGIEELKSRTGDFDRKLTEINITTPEIDLSPVKQGLTEGFSLLQAVIEAQPKKIVREFHFHLFPKLNIKEYYQTYSRLLLYFTVFLLAAGLVNIGVAWIEGYNRRQERLRQYPSIENYTEPTSLREMKNNKRKADVVKRNVLNQKRLQKVQPLYKDTLHKRLLMDSLRK